MRFRTFLASFLCAIFPSLTGAAEIGVTMSMPQDLTAAAGQIVTVPVHLSAISSSFSLDSFQFVVEYDGAFFETPQASGFKLGSLTTGKSYTGLDNIDPSSKSFTILRSNFSDPVFLTPDSAGSLMTFDIAVKPGVAQGSSGYLRFLASQGAATTEILTLSGDDIVFSPAITAPSVQGLVTVPVPEPSTYVQAVISTIAVAALAKRRSSARNPNALNRIS